MKVILETIAHAKFDIYVFITNLDVFTASPKLPMITHYNDFYMLALLRIRHNKAWVP
jgi:hypothetical protein